MLGLSLNGKSRASSARFRVPATLGFPADKPHSKVTHRLAIFACSGGEGNCQNLHALCRGVSRALQE